MGRSSVKYRTIPNIFRIYASVQKYKSKGIDVYYKYENICIYSVIIVFDDLRRHKGINFQIPNYSLETIIRVRSVTRTTVFRNHTGLLFLNGFKI